jgi:hypothetical protein
MKHEIFNLIIELQFIELWKSLQMAILAFLQLATSAASCDNLTTESDSLVNYWQQQSFLILISTWKCRQLPQFTSKTAICNFPNFSMVNKPLSINLGYFINWNTNNLSSNFLDLIWSTIRGERAFQILFDANYSPIGPTGKELS